MNPLFASGLLPLVVSVAGNLSIAGFFLSSSSSAWAGLPADYGMIIFMMEFLNVHASAMAYGAATSKLQASHEFIRKNPKPFLIGFYILGALALGIGLKNWVLPAYFTVGIIAKFFGRRATHDDRSIVYPILILMSSFGLGMMLLPVILLFGAILVLGFWAVSFADMSKWPSNQLFRDRFDFAGYAAPFAIFLIMILWFSAGGFWITGQHLWAILYFPSLAVNDTAIFLKAYFIRGKEDISQYGEYR